MSQGPIDHPSYLTRQQIFLGKSVAGSGGTSCTFATPTSNLRVRNLTAVVVTAGTSAGTGHKAVIQVVGTCTTSANQANGTASTGTTVLATLTLSSAAANAVATTGDLNVTLNAGAVIQAINGTDVTGVYNLVAEGYIDPLSTWTGN